jgi:lipoprotein-anchoring transpeptidase ErfK/SrfK
MAHGSIERVVVLGPTGGGPVTGSFGAGHATWHSTWALDVAERYTVRVTALDSAGRQVSATSSFRTLTPSQTFATQIFEGYKLYYGVGMPIILNFDRPVVDEAAVERSLEITTSKHIVGAWYWNGDEQVVFRPRAYWPAGTRVSFVGHLDGVEAAPGVYGDHTLTQTFFIGRSLIVVAGTQTHFMNVYLNGKLRYHWPISTGRSTLPTPNGTYVTLNKANPQLMVGPGYRLEVPWSVRFTLSGDFLHDAYWSVSQQGVTNVSHGCVNMPPADAEIYYKMALYGDPVTITGSPLAGKWNDGWTEWFLSWPQLLKGSALHEAVVAGPHGSRFVQPASLPAFQGGVPVQQPAPNSAAAT